MTTPFHSLDEYIAIPRLAGLWLSSDGARLVTSVAQLDNDRTKYVSALWEVDPSGERPARRLTRSAEGESAAAALPDGSFLFCSARPDPDAEDDDTKTAQLWLLPAGGGEAAPVASRPGGFGGPRVAREAGTVVVASSTLPSVTELAEEEQLRKERKERTVTAILHERPAVRHWDHHLGPDTQRLFVGVVETGDAGEPNLELRDLTGDVGHALHEADYDIAADGQTVVTTWRVAGAAAEERSTLVAIDVATGERRVIADDPDWYYESARISPDGRTVAAVRADLGAPDRAPDQDVVLIGIDGGEQVVLTSGWDRWPAELVWTPDGSALLAAADDNGRGAIFRIPTTPGEVTRITADDAVFTDPVVAPDGGAAFALRTSYLEPPTPVAVDLGAGPVAATGLRSPVAIPSLPGRLEEVETEAADGARVRAWLALPDSASATEPAPLLLWIHGGPMGSWNAWSWRWNPWLLVAQGYAVLLPDPALSTGYGRDFIARGWAQWGGTPYTDLMTITDAVLQRDDLDSSRTAAMGGSYGGYMANWVAGHTDRFDAIVSHCGLWAFDQFGPTTDHPPYWRRQMTPAMQAEHSPHHHVAEIGTPMLVIHGEKDYRVPIGEGLRLWNELAQHHADEAGRMPHKFLYFPDENHWVLKPQHAKVWYQTVSAFLAHHVLGKDWRAPEILG